MKNLHTGIVVPLRRTIEKLPTSLQKAIDYVNKEKYSLENYNLLDPDKIKNNPLFNG